MTSFKNATSHPSPLITSLMTLTNQPGDTLRPCGIQSRQKKLWRRTERRTRNGTLVNRDVMELGCEMKEGEYPSFNQRVQSSVNARNRQFPQRLVVDGNPYASPPFRADHNRESEPRYWIIDQPSRQVSIKYRIHLFRQNVIDPLRLESYERNVFPQVDSKRKQRALPEVGGRGRKNILENSRKVPPSYVITDAVQPSP